MQAQASGDCLAAELGHGGTRPRTTRIAEQDDQRAAFAQRETERGGGALQQAHPYRRKWRDQPVIAASDRRCANGGGSNGGTNAFAASFGAGSAAAVSVLAVPADCPGSSQRPSRRGWSVQAFRRDGRNIAPRNGPGPVVRCDRRLEGPSGRELVFGNQRAVRTVEQAGDGVAGSGEVEAVSGALRRPHEIPGKPAATAEWRRPALPSHAAPSADRPRRRQRMMESPADRHGRQQQQDCRSRHPGKARALLR